jgi:hypothetical protein
MVGRVARAAIVTVLALGVLAACSGGEEPKADRPPSAATSDAPSPSPTPTAPPTLQPDLQGVDVRVQNLDRFAADPVVAQMRVMLAATVRTSNDDRVDPVLRATTGPRLLKQFVATAQQAWDGGWTSPTTMLTRIERSGRGQLVFCLWTPSNSFRKDGKEVRTASRTWTRGVLTVAGDPPDVRFTDLELRGTCDVPAP